ncbi:hypothetical protein [Primorskyibacter sp. S187A]|uniref:hypothetical protein n=1 Tax=Primorskyibacter sp. S187A TaxID=3415130 RepID=UPI003C7AB5DE
MNWSDLTNNLTDYLGRLKSRFPNVDEDVLPDMDERSRLVEHIAARHDLTAFEASQEIDDWLFIESLARQASEMHVR